MKMACLVHLVLCCTLMTTTAHLSQEECPAKYLCTKSQEGSTINCSASGFSQLPQMSGETKVLIMTGNGISQFDGTWIESKLPNLQTLLLDRNSLVTDAVSGAGFAEIFPHLQDLDMSHNKLANLPRNLPPSLKTLQLGYNQMESIQASALTDLPTLEGLFLEGNIITAIDEHVFTLPSLPDSPPGRVLQNLKHLELSNNSISHISELSLTGLTKLEALSLAYNKLSRLNVHSFKGLRSLQYLDVSYNELSSIQNLTFKQLASLRVLYLNNNFLKEVPQGMPYLDWADLSGNLIKHVNETLSKKDIYPIEMLNLANNPLHCDCKMLWLKELWDRREYIVDQSDNIDPENFIPVCETPSSLHGELWTLLGDDVFVCEKNSHKASSQSQDHGRWSHNDFPDMSEFDQNNKNMEADTNYENDDIISDDSLDDTSKSDQDIGKLDADDSGASTAISTQRNAFIQDYDDIIQDKAEALTLEASKITDNSMTIEWHGTIPADVRYFFVRYQVFGQSNTPLFAQVNSDSSSVQLQGLRSQTNYVICLIIPSSSGSLPDNTGVENCIEVTTKSSSLWVNLPFSNRTIDYYFKVLFCSFLVSCIICGICLLVFEVGSRVIDKLLNSSGAKQHKE